ncbi:hypothetical protein MNBD_ALPHA06-2037 [hydrothermal vent metagenome]|uniref:histidine kinase n=1 Tax=hydrothermal vent metagenome TaxID=652676 RepID=A0A3B0R8F2_9ZZZZ
MKKIYSFSKPGLLLLSAVLLLQAACTFSNNPAPMAKNGSLSAPNWMATTDPPLKLVGEWEVIWGRVVGPTEFDAAYRGDFAPMPGRWNTLQANGAFGAATYRLRLDVPKTEGELSFHMISPNGAWRLFVDDLLVGGNGEVSENPNTAPVNYVSRVLPANDGTSVLVLQISNFTHAYGGPGHPVTLWDKERLQQSLGSISLVYILILGVLFSIGLFHMIFYLADRKNPVNGPVHLWFSLLCFILVFRISGIIPYFHIFYAQNPYWSDLKLVYLSLFLAPSVYLLFFRSAFRSYFPVKTTLALIWLGFAMSLFVLVTPEKIYTLTRDFSIFLNVLVIIFSMVFTAKAVHDKQPGAGVILVTNFIFLLTAIHDAVIYTDHGMGFDLTPFGVLILGLGHSYALLLRLQFSFLEAKKTSKALEVLNLELEQQVHERTKSFQFAAAKAQDSAQERARFMAAASHDLRQPLHALALFNSAIKRLVANKKISELVEKQAVSIRNLGALLQDTLDTAWIETGKKEPVFARVNISNLFDKIASGYVIQAQKRNIKLSFSTAPGHLITDLGMVQRILSNLVDNALKAASSQVDVRASQRAGVWVFEVQDDGPGVSGQDAKRIFEQYVSLRDETPGTEGGYGLGLFVVNEFTHLLDGKIELDSSNLKGSLFRLSLPDLDRYTEQDDAAKAIVCEVTPPPGTRVLVIDDELEILDAMQALLLSWGCKVKTASSAKAAQQHLSAGFAPQVLIVDFHLRKDNGLDLIESLQKHASRQWPTLICTGATEPAVHALIRAKGYDLLIKPIDPVQLGVMLAKLLNPSV